jgi:hypothetical protein
MVCSSSRFAADSSPPATFLWNPPGKAHRRAGRPTSPEIKVRAGRRAASSPCPGRHPSTRACGPWTNSANASGAGHGVTVGRGAISTWRS